jgi:mono/diheme cytochrome c family protein
MRVFRALIFVAVFGVASLVIVAYTWSFSALPQPGRLATGIVTHFKHWSISRAARSAPPEPPADESSAAAGQMAYGSDCSSCHGLDGRTPSNFGHSMYPRVPDLGSPGVQEWSNAELFWIIKNGIRHSGMPGFARIHPDDTIWDLVHYVRGIPSQPQSNP